MWSYDEHTRFVTGIERFKDNWKRVAEYVGTRTHKQTRLHANDLRKKGRNHPGSVPADLIRLLTPSRDQWKLAEVTKLNHAIKLFGSDKGWGRIAKFVQTKTRSQIRNYVKCNLSRKKKLKQSPLEQEILEMCEPRKVTRWTKAEKAKFVEGVQLYKCNWKKVRDHVGSKTLSQVIGRRSTILRFTKDPDPALVDQIKTKPHTKFSQWSDEEHGALIEAIRTFKDGWRKNVTSMVKTKTYSQIHGHFRYHYMRAMNDRELPNAKLLIENYYTRKQEPKIILQWTDT